jgi:peroxiredoxin
MKYIITKTFKLFCLVFTISVLASCGRNNVVIKGNLNNCTSKTIYLFDYNLLSSTFVDSAKIKPDGSFKFKIKTTEPKMFQLSIAPGNFILLLANKGEKIHINADAKAMNYNYSVKGSQGSAKIKLLTDHLNYSREKIDSILSIYNKIKGKKELDPQFKSLNEQYAQIINDQRKFNVKFIIENLKSIAGVVALYQQFDDSTFVLNENRDLQYVKLLSDTLSKYYPSSKIVVALNNDRSRLMTAYNNLKLASLANTSKTIAFPEIVLPDIQGDSIKLSNIKSKCILLFFWNGASEDDYVILNSLTELFKKYHGKGFEIYSVALINDKQSWIDFIQKSHFPWLNVIDKNAENSVYARTYNLNKLPETFLIGPNSDVIERDIFGEKLENKIKSLLEKK